MQKRPGRTVLAANRFDSTAGQVITANSARQPINQPLRGTRHGHWTNHNFRAHACCQTFAISQLKNVRRLANQPWKHRSLTENGTSRTCKQAATVPICVPGQTSRLFVIPHLSKMLCNLPVSTRKPSRPPTSMRMFPSPAPNTGDELSLANSPLCDEENQPASEWIAGNCGLPLRTKARTEMT